MAAAPARRTPVHDHRPRRVVPRTAMDHPRPANHDPPVVATVAAVMAAVVAIGAAIVPVSVVVATAIPVVVAAAVVAAMATVVVAGRCRGGHRHRRQGEKQGCERSEEHTSELQSLMRTSYAVSSLK